MIRFAVQQWDKNKHKLEEYYRDYINNMPKYTIPRYEDIVKNLVKYVYSDDNLKFNHEGITEIDNGDYQGTVLYMIPEDSYQPTNDEYLLTYTYYGSCSGCDSLLRIFDYFDESDKEGAVADLMSLSLELVQNTIKPYNNSSWKSDKELFEEIK